MSNAKPVGAAENRYNLPSQAAQKRLVASVEVGAVSTPHALDTADFDSDVLAETIGALARKKAREGHVARPCPIINPVVPTSTMGLDSLASLLHQPRRLTGAERDEIYSVIEPFARALPDTRLREQLPNLVFFEPKLDSGLVNTFHSMIGPQTIEILYHATPVEEGKKSLPGHTGVRVGDIWFENFNALQFNLAGDVLGALAKGPHYGTHFFGFVLPATPEQIHALQQAFLTRPTPQFDYLRREGRENCNHFVTSTIAETVPELGVVAEQDPLHLYNKLLWEHPSLKLVTVYSNQEVPALSAKNFHIQDTSQNPLYPDQGEHPVIQYTRRLVNRIPVGRIGMGE